MSKLIIFSFVDDHNFWISNPILVQIIHYHLSAGVGLIEVSTISMTVVGMEGLA